MQEIDHWDEFVVELIENNYSDSKKGDGWVQCDFCNGHLKLDELVDNGGSCMICEDFEEATRGMRGI